MPMQRFFPAAQFIPGVGFVEAPSRHPPEHGTLQGDTSVMMISGLGQEQKLLVGDPEILNQARTNRTGETAPTKPLPNWAQGLLYALAAVGAVIILTKLLEKMSNKKGA